MKKWDARQTEYILDRGWKFDKDEKLILTEDQFKKDQYAGRSITNPEKRVLMLPSNHGCCLIFEGLHFIVKEA